MMGYIGLFLTGLVNGLTGSVDACHNYEIWHDLHGKLLHVLSTQPLSPEHLRFSEQVFSILPLEPESLDGHDCWWGVLLPSLVASASDRQSLPVFQYYIQLLFSVAWDYTVFESVWPVFDSLLYISRALNSPAQCPGDFKRPSSVREASRQVYEAIHANEVGIDALDHLSLCNQLEFVSNYLYLSHHYEESAVGYTAAVYDVPRILGKWLQSAEDTLGILGAVVIWEQIVELQALHVKLVKGYTFGSYSDQLERIEKEYRAVSNITSEVPSAFQPVHSEFERQQLVQALGVVAGALEKGKPFVMAGTALGAMRYQALNPWEHDAELAIDTRHHWTLVKTVVQQVYSPESSELVKNNVRLDLAVRRGYSHKFYPWTKKGGIKAVYVEDTPGTRSLYPHGDVIEVIVTDQWVGQVYGWKSAIQHVFPLKKRLAINGLTLYTPNNLQAYVADYFRSFYGLEEAFQRVCRGHRHAVDNTVDCASLDEIFPRVFTAEDWRCAEAIHRVAFNSTEATCSISGDLVFYVTQMTDCENIVAWPMREVPPKFLGFVAPEDMKFQKVWEDFGWRYGVLGSCQAHTV